MSPGATFERVYVALKDRIVSGAYRPGEHLEPAALSGDLMASITPVRDALHRLVGERLVQTPRNDGFRVPVLTEAGLRDLYGWNLRLLHIALAGAPQATAAAPPGPPPSVPDLAARTGRLFCDIARLSRSAEHLAALAGVNDRLQAVRRQEAVLLEGTAELDELDAALEGGDFRLLRRLVSAYHRRRIARVARLLEGLQPSY